MESKENSIEEIQNKVQKSVWNEPVIYTLDYKITKSGGPPDYDEELDGEGATS